MTDESAAADESTLTAASIMDEFARETGVASSGSGSSGSGSSGSGSPHPPRRYLWTDAFAVCNYIALRERTGDEAHLERASALVDQVHRVLGRHREDDQRTGWISGLDEEEGERHPTRGGLRIGKRLPERGPSEPADERLEWDRDGQYFHYLTRWMHALSRMAEATGRPEYHRWAVELAEAAFDAFTFRPRPGGPVRIYWKMSIDLSRPLVESMGAHDPLDGLVTFRALAARTGGGHDPLQDAIHDLEELCEGRNWATDDPLGIGGLLLDVHRVAGLVDGSGGAPTGGSAMEGPAAGEPGRLGGGDAVRWLENLMDDALGSLGFYQGTGPLRLPAEHRLAFRELGLAIGMRGVEDLQAWVGERRDFLPARGVAERVDRLAEYLPLGRALEEFWLDPASRSADTWTEHEDINRVMLAASQVPEGWLGSLGASP